MRIVAADRKRREHEGPQDEAALAERVLQSCGTALTRTREVLGDTYRHVHNAEVLTLSAGLSYISLVSFLPLMAVSFVIFKAFGGMNRLLVTIEPFIRQVFAQETAGQFMEGVAELTLRLKSGTLTLTALAALIFSAIALFSSVEKAINRVWENNITRSWLRRIAAYWLVISLGPLAFVIAVGIATSDSMSLKGIIPGAFSSFLVTGLLLYAIYKWVPDRQVHWGSALSGAFLTASILHITRFFFSRYTDSVLHSDYYGRIYGSMSVIAIVILLVFVTWVIFFVGASLSVSVQRQIECRLQEEALAIEAQVLQQAGSPKIARIPGLGRPE